MNLFWVIVLTFVSVILGTGTCFWLLHLAREVDSTVWVLEHILCPITKIIVLLLMVSLIYPAIDETSTTIQFWQGLAQQGQFNDIINVLFFAGLVIAFIPVVSHPVLALPLQSILTIALIFNWQYHQLSESLQLFPSAITWLKIIVYMVFIYFVTRETSIHLSRWVDKKMVITGSIRIISDGIYLVLQIPVMLIYIGWLKSQTL
ncbi:MAG: hypothetical protein AAF353_10665 [Pseudomonadota bacterium]